MAVYPQTYGAKGDGSTDDASAIQSAITAAAASNDILIMPPGTYIVSAGTSGTAESGAIKYALGLASNLHIRSLAPGTVTIKLAANQSTDAAVQNCAMFFSNGTLSNISLQGLILDMNGANNKISPSRHASYNTHTFAHVSVSGTPSGVAARATDVLIEDCQFINTPGASCILLAQSNTALITLGKRWTIRNCLFNNNGLDTNDHSSIYGWADDVLVEGCTFDADTMFATTGSTGGNVACEIHGANHRFVNNKVKNYYQGLWVAANYSCSVKNVVIDSNVFAPMQAIGVGFYRDLEGSCEIQSVVISNNTFEFDNSTIAADLKVGVEIAATRAVTDVTIDGNGVRGTGDNKAVAGFNIITAGEEPGEKHDRIHVVGNRVTCGTFGIFFSTTATNRLGQLFFHNNVFSNLHATAAFANPMGIICNSCATGQPVDSLSIVGNEFVDTQETPTMAFGIYLQNAQICNLYVGPQNYVGIQTSRYTEASLGTVTNRSPQIASMQALDVDSCSGFLYIPTTTAYPTGTPQTVTGAAPLVWDSVNCSLYVYSYSCSKWACVPMTTV